MLSALGIGISICMMITLSGFASGTLFEISDRWEAVDADLIVYPREWGDNLTTMSGVGLSDKYVQIIQAKHGDIVKHAVPVFLSPVKFAGQDQVVVGVDSSQWATLTGGRKITEGRLFDPQGEASKWIEQQLLAPASEPSDVQNEEVQQELDKAEMARRGALEIVIDTRLAQKGKYTVGQKIQAAGHEWTVAGIVPAGAMGRVFLPRRTAQYLLGLHGISKSTLIFVKLKPGVDAESAALSIRRAGPALEVIPIKQYRQMLQAKYGVMFRYIDAVNVIAMIIAFLFIMVTLYMMVLQRTREIAILKSCGASDWLILRMVMEESLILTMAGTVFGIALSFFAAEMVAIFLPLYTVTITPTWLAIAVGTALVGAIFSAIYPAWRASRVDMVEAQTLE